MKKYILIIFLMGVVLSFGQMQDNPTTESGRVVKNAAGQVTINWESLILTGGVWQVTGTATSGYEVVNWTTMTNYVGGAGVPSFQQVLSVGNTSTSTLDFTSFDGSSGQFVLDVTTNGWPRLGRLGANIEWGNVGGFPVMGIGDFNWDVGGNWIAFRDGSNIQMNAEGSIEMKGFPLSGGSYNDLGLILQGDLSIISRARLTQYNGIFVPNYPLIDFGDIPTEHPMLIGTNSTLGIWTWQVDQVPTAGLDIVNWRAMTNHPSWLSDIGTNQLSDEVFDYIGTQSGSTFIRLTLTNGGVAFAVSADTTNFMNTFVVVDSNGTISATSSNVVIGLNGKYDLYMDGSFLSSGNGLHDGHFFTNLVQAVPLPNALPAGFSRSIDSANSRGTVVGSTSVNLSDGDTVEFGLFHNASPSARTFTWEHFNLLIRYVGPQ